MGSAKMNKSGHDTGGSSTNGYRFLVRALPEFAWITDYFKHRHEFRCMSDGVEAALRYCYLWRSLLWQVHSQPQPDSEVLNRLEQELISAYYWLLSDLALIEREMQKLGLNVPAKLLSSSLAATTGENRNQAIINPPTTPESTSTRSRSQSRRTAIVDEQLAEPATAVEEPFIDQGLIAKFGSLGIGVNLMQSDETSEEDRISME